MLASPFPSPRRRSNRDPYQQIKAQAQGWAFTLDPGSRWNAEHASPRLVLFSEKLAAPARPIRDRWYAAWRAVADAVVTNDLVGVIVALTGEATDAFHDLDGLARRWRSAAGTMAPPPPGARTPLPRAAERAPSPPPDRDRVRRWLTDLAEFRGWARAIAAALTLSALVRWTEHEFVAPVASPEEFARTVLGMIVRRADAAEYAAVFDEAGGPQRLARFTAVTAAVVAPPPLGAAFHECEFPDRGRVPGARYLLAQAAPFIERCHTHDFIRRYLTEPAADAPPEAGRGGTGPARPLASGRAAAPVAPPLPPPPASLPPPDWIARHFSRDQRKLLLALWGRDAVSAADLGRALGYPAGLKARRNLGRRVGQTNTNLADRLASIGGGWVIESVEVGGARAYRLRPVPK